MIKLHKYQERGVAFIKEKKKCALHLGMGLGKTALTLTAIKDLIADGSIKKVLIIAPKHVANSVWHSEIEKWEDFKHLTYSIVTGSIDNKLLALKKDVNIYITNRDSVSWLFKLKKRICDMIVVDESSSFKNPSSKRFNHLKKFKYKYMVQLSGTPAPNGLLDLWSQTYLLDTGERLGKSIYAYKQTHFIGDFFGYKFIPKNPDVIYKRISDIVLSMQTEDYLDLPERIDTEIKVDNPELEKYKELKKEFILAIKDQKITAANAAVLTGKLLQFCNGAMYDKDKNTVHIHNAKLDALQDIIDDNPNETILVAYNFKSDLERLKDRFKGAVKLDGSDNIINRWNKREIKLLLAHPASCGKGLNLQGGGNIVVWFGLTWNLEDYLQFNARLHRQGQNKPTIINHIVMKDCVDEIVLSRLKDKNTTQQSLFDALRDMS